MAISKVTLNGDTLMDVTQDTVAANNLLSGETATGADGVRLTGTLVPSAQPVLQEKTVTPTTSTQVVTADTAGDVICRIPTGVVSSNKSTYNYGKSMVNVEKAIARDASVYKIVGEFTVTYSGITTTITLDDYCAFYLYDDAIETVKFNISPADAAANSVPKIIKITGVHEVRTDAYFSIHFTNSASRTITVTKEIRVTEIGEFTDLQQVINVSSDDGYGSPHTWTYDLSSFTNGDLVSVAGTVGDYFASDIVTWENGFTIADSKTGVIIAATSSSITITNAGYTVIKLYIGKAELASYYDGLSQVTVNPIPSQYIIPFGTKTITENGTGIDVASYANVDVNVAGQATSGVKYIWTDQDGEGAWDVSGYQYCAVNGAALLDGHTRLWIDRTSTSSYVQISVNSAATSSNPIKIDWGDGTIETKTSGKSWQHVYTSVGKYIIDIELDKGVSNNITGYNETNIVYAEVSNNSNGYKVANLRFNNNKKLKKVIYNNDIQFIYTGGSAFSDCTSLETVVIPDTVTAYGVQCFSGCTSLKSIVLPPHITQVKRETFFGCSALIDVTLPEDATIIDQSAFQDCSALPTITIPALITSIGSAAFAGCTNLTEIHFHPSTPPTVSYTNTWNDLPTTCKIYVPTGTLSAYTSAANYPDPATYTYIEE